MRVSESNCYERYHTPIYDLQMPELDCTPSNYDFCAEEIIPDAKKNSKKATPPRYVVVKKQKVSFNHEVEVFPVERIPRKAKRSVWYSEKQLAAFEQHCSTDKELITQGARSYNHTRRVLLHQKAYSKLGTSRNNGLDVISRECSRRSKKQARTAAMHLAEEVDSWSQPSLFDFGAFDFYVSYLSELFPKHQFCGSE